MQILAITVPIYVLIGLGYAAVRLRLFERGDMRILGHFVIHFALPALLFLALCIGVIVLSQVMAWVGVSATYDVVRPPSQSVDVLDLGGSLPGESLPAEQPEAGDYEVVTETVAIEGLLTAEGIRFLFTSFVPMKLGTNEVNRNRMPSALSRLWISTVSVTTS